MTPKSLITTACMLAALLGACGDDDSTNTGSIDGGLDSGVAPTDGGIDASAPTAKLFSVPSQIYGADFNTSTSFVPVVPSLDVPEISLDKAREVDGRSSIGVVGKWLFVASSSKPVVERFEVDERGTLVPAGSLNFMNYGVSKHFSINDWGAVFVSPTKAYLFIGSDGSHVIWNPTTMQITGEIPGPQGVVRAGYELSSLAVVRGNRMYRIFTNINYDTWDFLTTGQYLVVYDLDTDKILSQVEESRCPQMYNRPFVDEAGDIYFSGWVWTPGLSLVKPDYPKACALRVRAGQDTFDPTYKLDFATITGGREAGILRYLGNGKALLDVFHAERTTVTPTTDPKKLTEEAHWRLWTIDLKTNTGAPLEGFGFKAGGYTDVTVDGRVFVMVPDEKYTWTTAYDVTDGTVKQSFKVKGSSYNIARVR